MGVAAAVTVGLTAAVVAEVAAAVGVTAASRVWVVSATLTPVVGVSAAAVAGVGVRNCWALGGVDAPVVAATAARGCRRGVTGFAAAAASVAFALEADWFEAPRALADGDGFVAAPRWGSLFCPMGLVEAVVDDAGPVDALADEPFVPVAVTAVAPPVVVDVDALSELTEPLPGAEVPD